jgi:hypothetical protein
VVITTMSASVLRLVSPVCSPHLRTRSQQQPPRLSVTRGVRPPPPPKKTLRVFPPAALYNHNTHTRATQRTPPATHTHTHTRAAAHLLLPKRAAVSASFWLLSALRGVV